MNKAISSLLATAALLATPAVYAAEPLDAATLQQHCAAVQKAPDSASAQLCTLYVSGFLDGAVATDARVAQNVAAEIDSGESFTERAVRTRVERRLALVGPTGYAEFCVGKPVLIREVVDVVVTELGRHEQLAGRAANEIVYDALRRNYPCVTAAA